MDDGIVALVGLIVMSDPSISGTTSPNHTAVSQLPLSLYLMAQRQIKLHHSLKSLTQTLDYVEIACGDFDDYTALDQLLLKLLLKTCSMDAFAHVDNGPFLVSAAFR